GRAADDRQPNVATEKRAIGAVEHERGPVGPTARRVVDRAALPPRSAVVGRRQVADDFEPDHAPAAERGVGVPAIALNAAILVERRPQPDHLAAERATAGAQLDLRRAT